MDFKEVENLIASTNNINFNVKGRIKIIPANKEKGFNYAYAVYIPETIKENTTMIVEGTNTGRDSQSLEKTTDFALESAKHCNSPIYDVATNFGMPVLYPIFPRWHNGQTLIYTHMLTTTSLDSKTAKLKEAGLERIDLQLINMINDAKEKFAENGIVIDEKIIIDGFSASSKFANRFTMLHPEIVKACIGGGTSGQLILPLEQINNEKLLYPIGIGNIEELLGEKITKEQIEQFKKVKHFYYMGLDDRNDPFELETIDENNNYIQKWGNTIGSDELKQLCKYLDKDIQKRWIKIQELYKELGIDVKFTSYKGIDHRPTPALDDINDFVEHSLGYERILNNKIYYNPLSDDEKYQYYRNKDLKNPKYLYHGTSLLLDELKPQMAYDSDNNKSNNDNAVFLTSHFNTACAHAFRQKTKENTDNKEWSIRVTSGELPIMIMDNVEELDDNANGYIYVFEYNDSFINDPEGSLQYKSYESLKPIDMFEIYYKDFKHLYSVNENSKSIEKNNNKGKKR